MRSDISTGVPGVPGGSERGRKMMRKLRFIAGATLLVLSLMYTTMPGLEAEAMQSPDATVYVPVRVADSKNVPFTSLKQEHFQLLEENKDQKVTFFSAPGEPMTVGVVLGLSASGPVKTAGGKDRVSVDILGAVERVREANGSGPANLDQLPLDSDGMYSLVSKNIASMSQNSSRRKALVIVSDGLIPSGGRADAMQVPKGLVETARLAPFPVYFLFAVTSLPEPALTESSSYVVGYTMDQLATVTGGQTVVGQIENNLASTATALRDRLKGQYILGFTSTNAAKEGKWRKLAVKVTPPDSKVKLKVDAKERYFVPKADGGK
jgi:Ca-activated chloride channel homolog